MFTLPDIFSVLLYLLLIFVAYSLLYPYLSRKWSTFRHISPLRMLVIIVLVLIVFFVLRRNDEKYKMEHFPYTQPNTEWMSDNGRFEIVVGENAVTKSSHLSQYDITMYSYSVRFNGLPDGYTASFSFGAYMVESTLTVVVKDNEGIFADAFVFKFYMPNESTLVIIPNNSTSESVEFLAGEKSMTICRVD